MKIVILVFAALLLVGSAFVGIVGANKARHLGQQMSELTGKMSDAEKELVEKQAGESIPSSGKLNAGAIVGYIGGLAAAVLLLVSFAKRELVGKVGPVAVVVTAVAAAIYPHVTTGPMEGMAPRPQALVAAALALVGFGLAMLAARKKA